MKIIAILFSILYFSGPGMIPEGVEFGHKKIDKEISKVIGSDDFSLEDIDSLKNISRNGNVLGRYYSVNSESKSTHYAYIGRVFTCPHGGCDGDEDISGTPEYFDYMILFDNSVQVAKISVFNYAATHGQEVCARGWLNQFLEFDGSRELKVGKNIDAISGATRSTNAMVNDITLRTNRLTETLSQR